MNKYILLTSLLSFSTFTFATVPGHGHFQTGAFVGSEEMNRPGEIYANGSTGTTGYPNLLPFDKEYYEDDFSWSLILRYMFYSSLSQVKPTYALSQLKAKEIIRPFTANLDDELLIRDLDMTLKMGCKGLTPYKEMKLSMPYVSINGAEYKINPNKLNDKQELMTSGDETSYVVFNEEYTKRVGNYLYYSRNAVHIYSEEMDLIAGRVEGYAFCPSK